MHAFYDRIVMSSSLLFVCACVRVQSSNFSFGGFQHLARWFEQVCSLFVCVVFDEAGNRPVMEREREREREREGGGGGRGRGRGRERVQ